MAVDPKNPKTELARSQAPFPQPAAGQIQRQEFGGSQLAQQAETSSAALSARQQAQVQARYIMAMRNPRSIDVVRDRMLKEAERPGFAASAVYKVQKGGSDIRGPSIRLAEALIQAMGNLHSQVTIVYDDADKLILTITVTDLETNATYEDEVVLLKRVERKHVDAGRRVFGERLNSRKEKVFVVEATEDEMLMKMNVWKSKSIRTAGLRLVPRYLVDELVSKCEQTMATETMQKLPETRAKMIGWFAEMGVSVEQLGQYLGHDAKQASVEEIGRLRGLGTAIKDGDTTWDAIVEQARTARAPAKATETVAGGNVSSEKGATSAPAVPSSAAPTTPAVAAQQQDPPPPSDADAPPHDPVTGEVLPEKPAAPAEQWPAAQTLAYAERLLAEMRKQTTLRELNLLSRRKSDCPVETHPRVLATYAEVKAKLPK